MDMHMLMLVGYGVAAFLVGGLVALHQVAPHTENTVDDKVDEYGQKALPWLVRVLEWLRGKQS